MSTPPPDDRPRPVSRSEVREYSRQSRNVLTAEATCTRAEPQRSRAGMKERCCGGKEMRSGVECLRRGALSHGELAVTIGAPVRRREDPRLLTGRGRYVGDVELPRLLHVAFVRSLHAHARVREIDCAAAAAQPGITAVLTGCDPAFARLSIRARSALPGYAETAQPVLAWPVVRFAGEALAAVVGVDRYGVEDAAGLITVEYDPLEAAVDLLRAT